MSAPLVDPALAQSSLAEQQMQAMQRQAEASRRDLNGGSRIQIWTPNEANLMDQEGS